MLKNSSRRRACAQVSLVYSDQRGNLRIDPDLTAVGCNGSQIEPADDTWIDLPAGGELLLLPGRLPLGYSEKTGEIEAVEALAGKEVTAVAAILPVGYTRLLLPGYEMKPGRAPKQELPLFGYTAVGSQNGQLKVAALQTDALLKWNPVYYNTRDLPQLIGRKQQKHPKNRILNQLAKCALEYHCLTAQNIFYQRWEAGIPVSPGCNAGCLGCISKQPAECCPAPQNRIQFIPTETEVAELAVGHLAEAPEAIISFGQGCEGEPSLQKELLCNSIQNIRRHTVKGTINMNTNAGDTAAVIELIAAGLDSVRVSLFSAIPENYNWYHHPRGYQLEDVKNSLKEAHRAGINTALNLLLFPGFTNQPAETEALVELIAETGVSQLQLRNLNLDPEKLAEKTNNGCVSQNAGVKTVSQWLLGLQNRFPKLLIGNYSRPKT
ncbi:MAG: radical SAM protein [Firmicutes bacterium]|nr:radical SAM protein [Bacillota bacterium]